MMRSSLLLLTLGLLLAAPAAAEDKSSPPIDPAGITFFETKIRPVLVQHCYSCHSQESGKAEGELRVDSRDAIRKGGDRGPAVVPGDPASSWLLIAAAHKDDDLKMPPKAERLSDAALADLRKWIEMGAPDPRDAASASKLAKKEFWASRPIAEVSPPAVKDGDWSKGPIDQFVLAKLEAEGLAPSPDASRPTLLRRLYFDLTGLPPGPADLARFLQRCDADGEDASLAAEVDSLLTTAQFGEHWGRHWLDVARFAESSGKEANITFPYAWRYRDYVIDSVTADVPYDRFLQEQIAGDLLPAANDADRARLWIATAFLAIGPKNLDEGNEPQFTADLIDEQIDTVTRAVLSNSVACARCHDHKFDPFSMEDYYGLAGVFRSTKTYFGTAVSPSNRVGGDPLVLPKVEGQKVLHASIPAKKVEDLKAKLAALRKEEEEKKAASWKAILEKRDASGIYTLQDALRIFWQTGGIEGELERVSDTGEALPLTMGAKDATEIKDSPLYERGDVARAKGSVPRAIPASLRFEGCEPIPADQSGRLQVAHWLTSPQNPITPRVFVNRVWHHLIGAGLVKSVDNFGSTGDLPSHPELLDHLASRFVNEGWSLKKLVRQIVLSRTYRQSSQFRRDAFDKDPDNRLVWRAAKRRLTAEAIRDAMLATSGELDPARPDGSLVGRVIGDRPVSLVGLDARLPKDLDGSTQRSVYLPVIRDRLPDILELFDFAEPSLVTGERETTNVPTQALYLMNSPFVIARAKAFAGRLQEATSSPDEQVTQAFQLCFGRDPLPEEKARASAFLSQPVQAKDESFGVLEVFCQSMLSTAEFRNLD
ncbi:PSD1 and planctomycete cytochrome C domain-containing protein [Caulifigura coniformis]|nr:PSD1 and planctomycete cytochrome C domain-containing protein [Caulifigura coniformis]